MFNETKFFFIFVKQLRISPLPSPSHRQLLARIPVVHVDALVVVATAVDDVIVQHRVAAQQHADVIVAAALAGRQRRHHRRRVQVRARR